MSKPQNPGFALLGTAGFDRTVENKKTARAPQGRTITVSAFKFCDLAILIVSEDERKSKKN